MRIAISIAAAAAAAMISTSAAAQVDTVTLHMRGLACPFCVYNVEKQVKKLDGLNVGAPIQSELDQGLISFQWRSGEAFSPRSIRKAAEKSGFTLRTIGVTASGAVHRRDDKDLRIVDQKGGRAARVVAASRADRVESWRALADKAGDEEAFRAVVRGEAQPSGDGADEWRLVLHGWRPQSFGALITMKVDDLVCENCSKRVMDALRQRGGVLRVEADHEADRVEVWTQASEPEAAWFRGQIEQAGFRVAHQHVLDLEAAKAAP